MKIIYTLAFFLLSQVLSSCDAKDKNQLGTIGDVTALEKRVDSRWKNMMSLDYEKVYGYFSPDYRRLNSYDKFVSTVGESVEWLSVKVEDIAIEGSYASVRTKIVYKLRLPGSIGGGFGAGIGELEKVSKESWVWRSDQWWFAGQFKQGI